MNKNARCDLLFKNTVLRACYDAMEKVGFTRFRKENVDFSLENDFKLWVGLNNALNYDYFEINPFVGVHSIQIEKFWNKLKVGKYPGKYDRGHATYAIHMGLLRPRERVFKFTRETDIDTEAYRLAQLYITAGLDYARSIASYEELLPLFQDRIPMLGAYPEKFTSCLYLMGRKDEARAFVQDFLKTHRDYFEGFAVPFLKLLTH